MKVSTKSYQQNKKLTYTDMTTDNKKSLCCSAAEPYSVVVLDVHVPFLYVLSDSILSG